MPDRVTVCAVLATLALMLRTQVSPLWPICAGAVVGAAGLV